MKSVGNGVSGRFSNRWKLFSWIFQSLETFGADFPIVGNVLSVFSNHWKPVACALLLTGAAAQATDYTNTIAASRSAITNIMAQYAIPGCTVVLVESQRVVWAEGFGYANKEAQTPVTTNTVMAIGSVSKMLTALMALQLVDTNAFDLDACITNYVSEFAMQPRFAGQENGWTLRTMLDHHSGVPGDIYNGAFTRGPYWPGYTDWLIEYFANDYPLNPPQVLASYCNSGVNIVGEAIARHDGVDFTVAAENRIFTPLDMPYSSFLPDKPTITGNLATGYNADGTPSPDLIANMPATGGAYSRPLDMANVIKMMLANGSFNGAEFLTTNALVEFGTATPGPLDVDNFFIPGLGLDSVDDPVLNYAGRTWLKNGSTGKFESLFEVLPDQQLGAFVNINCANSMTFAILHAVLTNAVYEKDGLMPTNRPPMPDPAESNWTYEACQGIEGDYVTKEGVDRFIAESNGSLSCIPNAQSSTAVVTNYRPHVNGRFYIPGHPEQQLVFTNIAGYDVIVRYGSDGSVRDEAMYGGYVEALYGTRCTLPEISAAWSNRCDTFWMAENIIVGDAFLADGNPSGCMLSCANGILSLISSGGNGTLSPTNDTLAFVGGLSTRGDSCVRIETNAAGQERLWAGGYRCMRLEDIPVITNREVAVVSVEFHTNALLLISGGAPGSRMVVVAGTNAPDAVLTVFSTEALEAIGNGTGSVEWVCDSDAAVISIGATNARTFSVKAVDVTETRAAMQRTLAQYPYLPGFGVAAQEPGFPPIVLAEGYARVEPPSTNGSSRLTGDEHFHIASISKMYTAAAIFLLQQRGLLNISNTVADVIPELNVPRGDDMTIEQVLEHRAGLPDANNTPWIDDKMIENPLREFTVKEIVAVASNMYPNLMSEPGTTYSYSDTGFNILAAIVEKISGTNFQAFVSSDILAPLGLTDTVVPYNEEAVVPEPAMSTYMFIRGDWEDRSVWCPSAEFGCGSIISTLCDLLVTTHGFFVETNLLNAETHALMMALISTTPLNTYGRGCNVQDGLGWGHDGTMWGALSSARVDTNNGVRVAACMNMQYEDERFLANMFALYSAEALLKNALGYGAGNLGESAPQLFSYLGSTRQGHAFRFQPLAFNFPTNWVITGLPAGMGYDATLGEITGTTFQTGDFPVQLLAENAYGTVNTSLTLSVGIGYTNTIAQMTDYLNGALTNEAYVGLSLALVDGSDVIWSTGFGYADREQAVPATAQTVYRIGSLSELFTATATLRESEFGRLDLGAGVDHYLDDFEPQVRPDTNLPPIDYTNHPITVRSLLNQLSGMPSMYMLNAITTEPYPCYPVESYLMLISDFGCMPVNFYASYNNNGFEVAEYLLEDVSGMSFEEYAASNLFIALNMQHTGFDGDDPALAVDLAASYDASLVRMPAEYLNGLGSSGALSSAEDMAAFMKMLLARGQGPYNPILHESTVLDMMSDQTTGMTLHVGTKYLATGLGWDTALLPEFQYAGGGCSKDGWGTTFAAHIALATNRNLGVFVVNNSPQTVLSADVAQLLLENAIEEKAGIPPPGPAELPASPFVEVAQSNVDALAGFYVSDQGISTIGAGSNCLMMGSEKFYLREDGWWGATNQSLYLIGFTNVNGSLFSKAMVLPGCFVETVVMGLKYTPPAITNEWTNRMDDTWLIQSLPDISYMRRHAGTLAARTSTTNSMLLLDMPSVLLNEYRYGAFATTRMVLEPYNDDLAFVQGVGLKMPCSVVSDTENLLANSYYWRNTRTVPQLNPSCPTNIEPCILNTDWFAFDAVAGVEYFLNLGGSVTGLFLLVDQEGNYLGDGSQGSVLRWTCPSSGVYYAGVNFPDDAPANVTVQFYNYTNTIEEITAWITNAMAQEQSVGCSIALVDGTNIVWARGFGYADIEAGIPVTTDTVFHIGSCSKAFTAVAALQYMDSGALDIDLPVTNFLPTLSWKERFPSAPPVTVRDLLDMYSGLPGDLLRDAFTTQPLGPGYAIVTNDLAQTYPVCPPNYYWNYCNAGFVVMEGVIEALANTGGFTRTFAQIADDQLFTPLGMDATSYLKDKAAISNWLAKPYLGGQEMPEEYVNIYGTGSMYSRPTDMAKFITAMLADGEPLLKKSTFDEMVTPQGTNAVFAPFFSFAPGLGWDYVQFPPIDYAGRICSKNGATLAYSAIIQLMIDQKLGVAITVSSSSAIPNDGALKTLRHALREKSGILWPTNTIVFNVETQAVSQVELDALAGVYVGARGYDLVEANPGAITYRMNVPGAGRVLSNMTLRTNGCFVTEDTPELALLFTNCANQEIVVSRYESAGAIMEVPLSDRYEPVTIDESWSNRIGRKWYLVNESSASYFPLIGAAPDYELHYSNGVLYNTGGGYVANRVLAPTSSSLAFIVGTDNRGDSCVQVIEPEGDEVLLVAGLMYGPEPEAVPVQSNLSGAVSIAGQSRWYEIEPLDPTQAVEGVTNVFYELTLSGAPSNFLLRLYQADGVTPVTNRLGNGRMEVVSGRSPLLLNIQPDLTGVQTGAYDVAFSLPLLIRAIHVRDSRFGMTWQGPSGVTVDVQSATNLAEVVAFTPLITNLPAPDVLNSYISLPGLDPQRFYRIQENTSANPD